MRQGAGFPDQRMTWHRRLATPGSPEHRAWWWVGRHTDGSKHPTSGKKVEGGVSWRQAWFYCFKLRIDRHTLPLCQEHMHWDLCKAQLFCPQSQGTREVPGARYLLCIDWFCSLLKKISLFSKQPAKRTKPFHASQASVAPASPYSVQEGCPSYPTLDQNQETSAILSWD